MISRDFDTSVEKSVRKGSVIRLGALQGIKIISIDDYSRINELIARYESRVDISG